MNDATVNPLIETDAEKVAAQEATRRAEVAEFTRTSPDYYADQFKHIGADARFTPTFNLFAGIFGPIWFGARGLWKWAVAFLIVETFAFVQMSRGLFGDLGAEAGPLIGPSGVGIERSGRWVGQAHPVDGGQGQIRIGLPGR